MQAIRADIKHLECNERKTSPIFKTSNKSIFLCLKKKFVSFKDPRKFVSFLV